MRYKFSPLSEIANYQKRYTSKSLPFFPTLQRSYPGLPPASHLFQCRTSHHPLACPSPAPPTRPRLCARSAHYICLKTTRLVSRWYDASFLLISCPIFSMTFVSVLNTSPDHTPASLPRLALIQTARLHDAMTSRRFQMRYSSYLVSKKYVQNPDRRAASRTLERRGEEMREEACGMMILPQNITPLSLEV